MHSTTILPFWKDVSESVSQDACVIFTTPQLHINQWSVETVTLRGLSPVIMTAEITLSLVISLPVT